MQGEAITEESATAVADRQETSGVPADPSKVSADVLVGELSEHGLLVERAAFGAIRRGQRVGSSEVSQCCGLGVDVVAAILEELGSTGRVQSDVDGAVVGIAGLSLELTSHRLSLNGVELFTWCGFDAVGIPASLGLDALATTRCPTCGTSLEFLFRGGNTAPTRPEFGFLPEVSSGDVRVEFCPQANLFCSESHLAAWRDGMGDPPGQAMSLAAFVELGAGCWTHLIAPECDDLR